MAGSLNKRSNSYNESNVCEFVVDTVDEVALLPTTTNKAKGKFAKDVNFQIIPTVGSTCIVGNGKDELKVYMLFSNGWKAL